MALSACQPQSAPTTVLVTKGPAIEISTLPPSQLQPSAPPAAAPQPTATAAPKTLTICMPTEPDTLYLYGAASSRESALARAAVLDALQDGPVDHRSYDYQPVILEKLPSVKDGDATVTAATVRDGETIVDSAGSLTTLSRGLKYFDPSGVEQTYDGAAGSVQALQLTVTFKLRSDLKWQDGQPLTTDDVLFAWELIKSPDNLASNHFFANRVFDPVAVDAQTVRWMYLPGFKDTLYYTRFPVPYPRHVYGRLTAAQLAADESANRRPLSFGPFKLEEWAAGDRITLSKNENYFRAAEGLPRLDRVTIRFVSDADKLIADLVAGNCNVAVGTKEGAQDSIFEGRVDKLLQAEAQGVLAAQFVPSPTFEHLDFNISPAPGYGGLVGKQRLFEDANVRRAFAYCIDRQALVDRLLYGRAEVPAVYVPPESPYYDSTGLTVYGFDPDRGRKLLKAAGWEDSNGDGVLDKEGRALSLSYYYGPVGNALRQSVAQMIQTQLKGNCGIEITPKELSRSDLFGGFPDGSLFGRQYDLGQFAWVADGEGTCALYTAREWTGLGDGQADRYGVATGYPEGGNDVGYLNPAFDEACLQGIGSLDPVEKKSLHHQAMVIFSQDVPSLILFSRLKIGAATPNVSGFVMDVTQDSDLWNIESFEVVR